MGEIKIDIPKDMEAAFEEAFPAEDKAAAVLRLIEAEIARRKDADSDGNLFDEALRLRQEPSYFADEDIRNAHEEPRNFVERLRQIRARGRPVTEDEIRRAREELRK